MGLLLTTDERGTIVYRKDKVSAAGNKYTTYSTKVSSKNDNDAWISKFYNLRFRKGVEVNNKAKINIKKAFPTLSEYNDVVTDTFMVLDFEVIEEGETPANGDAFVSIGGSDMPDFMKIDDSDFEGTPFN